jgi:hypothetical protein
MAHVSKIGDAVILWLTVNKDITAYRVRPLDSQMGGIAFRLEKADKGNGASEVYDVLLDGQQSRCCRGFEKHGMCKDGKGCKHIAGLMAAVTAQQLPIPASKPATEPARKVHPDCFECGKPYAECNCTV